MKNKIVEKHIVIGHLISDSLLRKLTKEEKFELDSWRNQCTENENLYKRLIDEKNFSEYFDQFKAINYDDAKKSIAQRVSKKRRTRFLQTGLKYAAIFVLALGSFYFLLPLTTNDKPSNQLQIEENTVTLKLGNGETKRIDSKGEHKILNQKGRVIGIQTGNKLAYEKDGSVGDLVYNTLNVPYGNKFQLELSDGTLVHLNAGSTLKYPMKFLPGQERKVFVTGEAYLEVAKDRTRPFIVNTNRMNVRVLGTKFNVSSYEDDESVNTVLVEGSVSLYDADESYSVENAELLSPGHMAIWDKQKDTASMEEVDTGLYIAWIEGKLIFRNTAFKTIRKKLERHYNVTIVNNNKELDEKKYNASFDIESIEQVMNSFNENFAIDFSIVDNKIIIN